MTKTLLEELKELQAAKNASAKADIDLHTHRDNPSWILCDVQTSEQFLTPTQPDMTAEQSAQYNALEYFYKQDLSSRNPEEDEEFLKAQEGLQSIILELKKGEDALWHSKSKLEEAERLLREKERAIGDKEWDVSMLEATKHASEKQLDDECNRANKERESAREESEQKSAAKISELDERTSFDKVGCGGVLKQLVIGYVISALGCGAILLIFGVEPPILTATIPVGIILFFAPLVKYRFDIKRSQSTTQKVYQETLAEIKGKENSSLAATLDAIEKESEEKSAKIKEEIEDTQQKLDAAIEDANTEKADLKVFQSEVSKCEKDVHQKDEAVQELETQKKAAESSVEKARMAFILSLADEYNTVKQNEQKRYDEKQKELEIASKRASAALNSALNLSSIDATFDIGDLPNIDRIIDKIQSHRASTLSEALNAVDADIAAETRHAEQMRIEREHLARIEEQARKEAEVNAEIERARTEELKRIEEQKARDLLDAANRQTALAEEAVAIQTERAEREEEQQVALIESNIIRCSQCIYYSDYPPVRMPKEDAFCEVGGTTCGQSDICINYLPR